MNRVSSLIRRVIGRIDPDVLGVVLFAAVVRIVYFLQSQASPLDGYHVLDHAYYLQWAREIAGGRWIGENVFEQSPLYPYAVGMFIRAFGERIDALLIVQLALGTLTPVLVLSVARRLADRPTAVAAGCLTAVYGPLIFYECMFMKSFLSPLLTMVALWATLRHGDELRTRWLWLSGLAVGLACLVRENHILLLPPMAAWVWWQGRIRGLSAGRRLRRFATLGVATLLCLLPATWHNWVAGREFVVVTAGGGEVFYMGHGPHANGFYKAPEFVSANPFTEHEDFRREAQRRLRRPLTRGESSRYWFGRGLDAIGDDPLRSLVLSGRKLLILLNDFEVTDTANYAVTRQIVPVLRWLPTFGWIAGLGLLGLVVALRSPARYALPAAFVFVHVVSIVLTYNFGRFRLGMTPLWCLFAVVGGVWLVRRSGNAPGRRSPRTWIALAAVIATTVVAFRPPPGYAEQTFEIDDAMLLGRLAVRAGDLDAAETHFDDALRLMRRHDERFPTHEGNQEALLALRCGEAFRAVGADDRADRFYEIAVTLPNRPEHREQLLRHWLSVLLNRERDARGRGRKIDVSEPMNRVLERLRELRPHHVEYWAIAARWTSDRVRAESLLDGLERAWRNSNREDFEVATWYHTGRALLLAELGHEAASRDAARRALQLVPNHPWRPDLVRLAQP